MPEKTYSRGELAKAGGIILAACGSIVGLWFYSLYGLPELAHRLEREVAELRAQHEHDTTALSARIDFEAREHDASVNALRADMTAKDRRDLEVARHASDDAHWEEIERIIAELGPCRRATAAPLPGRVEGR